MKRKWVLKKKKQQSIFQKLIFIKCTQNRIYYFAKKVFSERSLMWPICAKKKSTRCVTVCLVNQLHMIIVGRNAPTKSNEKNLNSKDNLKTAPKQQFPQSGTITGQIYSACKSGPLHLINFRALPTAFSLLKWPDPRNLTLCLLVAKRRSKPTIFFVLDSAFINPCNTRRRCLMLSDRIVCIVVLWFICLCFLSSFLLFSFLPFFFIY